MRTFSYVQRTGEKFPLELQESDITTIPYIVLILQFLASDPPWWTCIPSGISNVSWKVPAAVIVSSWVADTCCTVQIDVKHISKSKKCSRISSDTNLTQNWQYRNSIIERSDMSEVELVRQFRKRLTHPPQSGINELRCPRCGKLLAVGKIQLGSLEVKCTRKRCACKVKISQFGCRII